MAEYITLDSLIAYKHARSMSKIGWEIYKALDWRAQKNIGDQFIRAIDSHGANIAEGYGRYHYLDKVRFYYNARGSLFESKHWFDLLVERDIMSEVQRDSFLKCYQEALMTLNGLIKATMKIKKGLEEKIK